MSQTIVREQSVVAALIARRRWSVEACIFDHEVFSLKPTERSNDRARLPGNAPGYFSTIRPSTLA